MLSPALHVWELRPTEFKWPKVTQLRGVKIGLKPKCVWPEDHAPSVYCFPAVGAL